MASFSVVDIEELEAEGPGGMIRKTRRALGARAFGFNYFVFQPDTEGREHNHAEANQEEVYFVVRGSGVMRIDGEEVELKPGRFGAGRPRRDPRSGVRGGRAGVPRDRIAGRPALRAARMGLASALAVRLTG